MIRGWVRTTLIDFPGEIATLLFFGGCNLRCPMCHNPALVLEPECLPEVPVDVILAHLQKRAGKITGVVLSGGEPCLAADLLPVMQRFHRMGLKIKLDTNGYFPDVLQEALDAGWVDYVAMDIKSPLDKYPRLCGLSRMDLDRISTSIDLIRGYGGQYEFRTTVAPGLITPEDIADIGAWLAGSRRYVLQQFRPHGCLDPDYDALIPYPAEVLLKMQMLAGASIDEVLVRGI